MKIPRVAGRLVVPRISALDPEAGHPQQLRWINAHGDVAGAPPPSPRVLAVALSHATRKHVCGDQREIKR